MHKICAIMGVRCVIHPCIDLYLKKHTTNSIESVICLNIDFLSKIDCQPLLLNCNCNHKKKRPLKHIDLWPECNGK